MWWQRQPESQSPNRPVKGSGFKSLGAALMLPNPGLLRGIRCGQTKGALSKAGSRARTLACRVQEIPQHRQGCIDWRMWQVLGQKGSWPRLVCQIPPPPSRSHSGGARGANGIADTCHDASKLALYPYLPLPVTLPPSLTLAAVPGITFLGGVSLRLQHQVPVHDRGRSDG